MKRSALPALISALALASGCELVAGLEPCTPGDHAGCAAEERCGEDGFCRLAPDAGAGRDAGPGHDAGPPSDAGVDAGPDAGPLVDGGPPMDGGVPLDASSGEDAGGDAGADDAGGPLDAGYDAGVEPPCGNGVLNVDEECDDDNNEPGDGCDELCQLESGWLCTGAPSTCQAECGDGIVVEGEEECDDGAAGNSDTVPDACRTDCRAAGCGDGVLDTGEICDSDVVGPLYCLAAGYLSGTGAPSCDETCQALDPTTCGLPIDDTPSLRDALIEADARLAPTTIALQDGTFVVDATLIINSPHALTLLPLAGASVAFTPAASFVDPLIRLASQNNRLRGLSFVNATRAINVVSAGNVIERSLFSNDATAPPGDLVTISATGCAVRHSRFVNASGVDGGRAIHATAENDTRLERNLIQCVDGNFSEAIRVTGPNPNSNKTTFITHNTIDIGGTAVGMYFEGLGALCAFNNIVRGNGPTKGYSLQGSVTAGALARCGVLTQKNATVGMTDKCDGSACATLCDDGSQLCELTAAPMLNTAGCLSPSSQLKDAAVDVGVLPVDETGAPLSYTGAGPDVGARESGTSTAWGAGAVSTCP